MRMAHPAPCSAIRSSSPPRSTSSWVVAGSCPKKCRCDAVVERPPERRGSDRHLRRRAGPVHRPALGGFPVFPTDRLVQRTGGGVHARGPGGRAPDPPTVNALARHPGRVGSRRCHPPPRDRGRPARLLADLFPDHRRRICDGAKLWLRERCPDAAAVCRADGRSWTVAAVPDAGRRLGGYGLRVPRAPERRPTNLAIGHRPLMLLRWDSGPRLRAFARSLGMATAARPGFFPAELGTRACGRRDRPALWCLLPFHI